MASTQTPQSNLFVWPLQGMPTKLGPGFIWDYVLLTASSFCSRDVYEDDFGLQDGAIGSGEYFGLYNVSDGCNGP